MSLLRLGLISVLLCAGLAQAAPLTRNLGQGLAYFRVHDFPGDLSKTETTRQPCVLDLRYVTGQTEDAAALTAWLKVHATPRAPVIVLTNAETAGPLLAVIAPRGTGPSVVVIGAASPTFAPDIPLKIAADDERRAYDALDRGTLPDALITEKPDKPRNDEAKLAKERQTQADYVAAPEASATPATSADDATKSAAPAPPLDLALQRAVQLHRALLALKKI